MFNKKDMIFYAIVGNIIALIAGLAGASLPVILSSLPQSSSSSEYSTYKTLLRLYSYLAYIVR